MERLAKYEHHSLLQKSVNYDCKKFIVQAPEDVFLVMCDPSMNEL